MSQLFIAFGVLCLIGAYAGLVILLGHLAYKTLIIQRVDHDVGYGALLGVAVLLSPLFFLLGSL